MFVSKHFKTMAKRYFNLCLTNNLILNRSFYSTPRYNYSFIDYLRQNGGNNANVGNDHNPDENGDDLSLDDFEQLREHALEMQEPINEYILTKVNEFQKESAYQRKTKPKLLNRRSLVVDKDKILKSDLSFLYTDPQDSNDNSCHPLPVLIRMVEVAVKCVDLAFFIFNDELFLNYLYEFAKNNQNVKIRILTTHDGTKNVYKQFFELTSLSNIKHRFVNGAGRYGCVHEKMLIMIDIFNNVTAGKQVTYSSNVSEQVQTKTFLNYSFEYLNKILSQIASQLSYTTRTNVGIFIKSIMQYIDLT
ncbi:unnamed protein product [Didymodactylos carnosus]|uniref:Uncharacterized protein n=1 Tax=Didymodactylos carnosus TaxID=1234261 RepID=A0A814PAZ8_9BILA|nr:unnamed protein product [Didymodactylos carnosus]CAF3870066.1 unnamed protein product [Didymodactylos carnosus]